jgi:hypothetical protein
MRICVQDAVPKAVMHFLVLRVQRGLQQHLIKTLYRCRSFTGLLMHAKGFHALRTGHHSTVCMGIAGRICLKR